MNAQTRHRPQSGSFSEVGPPHEDLVDEGGVTTVNLLLTAETNTLSFHNDTANAPDLDRITIG